MSDTTRHRADVCDDVAEIQYARRLLRICDVAAGLSPADRRWFLERACTDDPRLRRDVDRLLEAMTGTGDFLEHGPGTESLGASRGPTRR